MRNYDLAEPIELKPGVWWVGYVIPNDPFQCHVYLIENGKDSILIDPGSKLTWHVTRRKIEKIIPLSNIRYIVAHHQDPDIVGCVEELLDQIGTKNRFVVTHWRTKMLLKHFAWGIEFYEVDKHEWRLKAGDLELEFIFTPYMHFPGNICTYYAKEKVLFSSDIFGALTQEFALFAKDAKSYFVQMKPFHMHYMPCKMIVRNGMKKIEKLDIDLIAPQHGSIIQKPLIAYLIEHLKSLDVGIYLEYRGGDDVVRLTRAHEVLSSLFKLVSFTTTSLFDKKEQILKELETVLPLKRILCFTFVHQGVVLLDSKKSEPVLTDIAMEEFLEYLKSSNDNTVQQVERVFTIELQHPYKAYHFVAKNEQDQAIGVCYLLFDQNEKLRDEDLEILKSYETLFSVMLVKERERYFFVQVQKSLLHRAITDGLTGLFNRALLDRELEEEIEKAKRYGYPLSVVMLDLDHFKKVNDTYGHEIGDMVLKDFANFLKQHIRKSDVVFRYGGEEFLILMPFTSKEKAYEVMQRLHQLHQERGALKIGDLSISYSFSAGIAQLQSDDTAKTLIERADKAMYRAKHLGRNRIEVI